MNNQIAPKQAAINHLGSNQVQDSTGARTRDGHQSDRSARSDRTDSFGSALRRAVQKSRDGRADTGRATAKAREARRSATNDQPGSSDRRVKQSEQAKSFDRSVERASDERASVHEASKREAEQLAESEQFEESGPARGTDTSNASNERELQQSGDPASGETAELVLNPHLVVGAADADKGEAPDVEAQDPSEAADEMLLEVGRTGTQPTTSDPAEDGAVDSQELAAKLATTINLEEVATSSQTPKRDPLDRESEQGRSLQSSDLKTGNLKSETQQPEDVSLGGPGPKQPDLEANTGLAPQVTSSITASDPDSLASVDGAAEGSADDLEAPGSSVDANNSAESQSSGDQAASDSSLSDMGRSADDQAETANRTSSAAGQDGPGNLSAQPLLSNSVTSSMGGAVKPTPVVDAVPEVSVADAQVLSAEALSTDGRSGDAVWRQVQRAIGAIRNLGEGDHEFKIRLTPRELGSVTIDIRSSEGGIAIGLVTETTAASDRLNQQRQQLLQELSDSGLDSSSVDISHEGPGSGLDSRASQGDAGQDVAESESYGSSGPGQQQGERSAQLPRRALGVNQLDGPGRLDIAL